MTEINKTPDGTLAVGDEVVGPSGQKYTVEAITPYRRHGGRGDSVVLHLRSICRKCGAEFVAKAGPSAKGASVHCPAHRLTPAEAQRIAVAAMASPEARRKAVATRARRRAQLLSLL